MCTQHKDEGGKSRGTEGWRRSCTILKTQTQGKPRTKLNENSTNLQCTEWIFEYFVLPHTQTFTRRKERLKHLSTPVMITVCLLIHASIISAADAASLEMTLQNLICKYRKVRRETTVSLSHQRACSKQGGLMVLDRIPLSHAHTHAHTHIHNGFLACGPLHMSSSKNTHVDISRTLPSGSFRNPVINLLIPNQLFLEGYKMTRVLCNWQSIQSQL